MVKVAINGFGRIGRLVFRYAWDDPTLEIVHVNDLCSVESAAYLVKYDSVHGTWNKDVKQEKDGEFSVDGKVVTFSQEKNYCNINFKAMGVEMVLECTGVFLTVAKLEPYLKECGVKRVIVSAPVKEGNALNCVLCCFCSYHSYLTACSSQVVLSTLFLDAIMKNSLKRKRLSQMHLVLQIVSHLLFV